MNKLVTTIAFVLLMIAVNAQKLSTFHCTVLDWNSYTSDWEERSQYDSKIDFEMKGDYLTATDKGNSRYLITNIRDEEDNFFSCDAIDEKGIECVIMISDNKYGVDKIAIMYSCKGLLFEYWFYFN